MGVLQVAKLPTIPKKWANQQIIYRAPTGEKDRYGKQKVVDTVIDNCIVQLETVYSGTNNNRQVVANGVVFLYANITMPFVTFDKNSQGNKIIYEDVEYTLQRIIDNRDPFSNEVWSYELEVL